MLTLCRAQAKRLRILNPLQTRSISYRIKISTGDYRGAGTDANIQLQLFGNRGKSPLIALSEDILTHSIETSKQGSQSDEWDHTTSAANTRPDLVQRNTTQTFSCEVPKELGELKSIQIGHDNEGLGSGWFLAKVVVESDEVIVDDDDTPKSASFQCNKW